MLIMITDQSVKLGECQMCVPKYIFDFKIDIVPSLTLVTLIFFQTLLTSQERLHRQKIRINCLINEEKLDFPG